jgi:hypothetical protein
MKRTVLIFSFILTVTGALASAPVWAHEGHAHKVMGTVCAVHADTVKVTGTDGKSHTLTLTEKTKVVRGSTPVKASDLRPGYRVVATATETKRKDGTTTLTASRIQVGTVSPTTADCAPE